MMDFAKRNREAAEILAKQLVEERMKDKPADIRELLTAASIAAYREHVIEECARTAKEYLDRNPSNHPLGEWTAEAIRALKERT